MKSPCYLVTLSLESSDFQTFLKQYVILVPFGALIFILVLLSHNDVPLVAQQNVLIVAHTQHQSPSFLYCRC